MDSKGEKGPSARGAAQWEYVRAVGRGQGRSERADRSREKESVESPGLWLSRGLYQPRNKTLQIAWVIYGDVTWSTSNGPRKWRLHEREETIV